jgi:prolyl-tRNA editing enzyme YbaK/EbsC (Cys-tRNA(Pro) deacylase)
MLACVFTGVVFHEYVYGGVPPLGVTPATPLPLLLQLLLELFMAVVIFAGCVMITVSIVIQNAASRTVTK